MKFKEGQGVVSTGQVRELVIVSGPHIRLVEPGDGGYREHYLCKTEGGYVTLVPTAKLSMPEPKPGDTVHHVPNPGGGVWTVHSIDEKYAVLEQPDTAIVRTREVFDRNWRVV